MPVVTFVHANGTREDLEVSLGSSIMHAAVNAGIDGIVGECGGSAMCATCHVYISSEGEGKKLPEVSAVEDEMLNSTVSERRPNSRLSCQLLMTAELEGLVLILPEAQV